MRTKVITVISAVLLSVGFGGCKSDSDTDLVRLAYPESFDRAMKQFKGRMVYVGMFASWCKPCIEQFGYAAQTDDFFSENNIAKLYISVDYDVNEIRKAFNLLKRHDMKGWFLSLYNPAGSGILPETQDENNDFYSNIQQLSELNGRMIPQYIIIDKTGNVVEYKAEKPSDPEALKEQLSKYL